MKYDPGSLTIESASISDAAGILEIQKQAFYHQAVLYDDFTLPPLVQTLNEFVLDFAHYAYLKAVYANKIAGSVRGRVEAGTCFISRLIVHPDYQGNGIGKMLMQAIEKKFNEAKRYELYTGHKSEKNLALYSKLGYREYDRKPQSARVMLICMQKRNDVRAYERSFAQAMKDYRIDFTLLEWDSPMTGVRQKVIAQEGKKLRLVEYTREMPRHSCMKGHFGYILEGRLEIEFPDGVRIFERGDGVFIPDGEKHQHKARVLTDVVRAVFVEDI